MSCTQGTTSRIWRICNSDHRRVELRIASIQCSAIDRTSNYIRHDFSASHGAVPYTVGEKPQYCSLQPGWHTPQRRRKIFDVLIFSPLSREVESTIMETVGCTATATASASYHGTGNKPFFAPFLCERWLGGHKF